MLVALSLLSFLGLRYPLQMLPILLFELAWKFIWVTVVVFPLWTSDQMDPATLSVFYSCLVVLIVAAVILRALRDQAGRPVAQGARLTATERSGGGPHRFCRGS
jgi:hypothetical protein